MENRSILVAVDFGATSMRAFAAAVELAARLGSRLDLVNICPPIPIEAEGGASAPYVAFAREELAALAATARARGVEVATHVRNETVVFGLLEAITELEPELVVIGSHGRRGVARALLGSISESLARRSPVPVMIVPSPERQKIVDGEAWSCEACGHIFAGGERPGTCSQCGARPAHWLSAPLTGVAADAGEPAVGEGVTGDDARPDTQDAASLFATAPAGGFDRTEANAEIRIRRF
jgi:universal stress protein A